MKKIIIIDNETVLRLIFEEIFENRYEIIFTHLIADTIVTIINNKDVALIITEFNIKNQENAAELFEILKAFCFNHIPVLVFSLYEEHRLIVNSNGHSFFELPIDVKTVLKMVGELVYRNEERKY